MGLTLLPTALGKQQQCLFFCSSNFKKEIISCFIHATCANVICKQRRLIHLHMPITWSVFPACINPLSVRKHMTKFTSASMNLYCLNKTSRKCCVSPDVHCLKTNQTRNLDKKYTPPSLAMPMSHILLVEGEKSKILSICMYVMANLRLFTPTVAHLLHLTCT